MGVKIKSASPVLKKTIKQQTAIELLNKDHIRYILLSGGSRSGKTFIFVYAMVVRAMKETDSRHLIARFHHKDVIASVGRDTLPKVLKLKGIPFELNRKDWIFTFPNGSEIWLGGLDDDKRVEKILGLEYSTIYFNESSQIPYHSFTTALTRLAQKTNLVNKVYVDCNPPTKSHWLYKYFIENTDPETNVELSNYESHAVLDMNPIDNVENLPPNYIEETLANLPERKRRRFLNGEWLSDPVGALWNRSMIDDHRVKFAPVLKRIVLGIDPAVTSNEQSSETGMIVAGIDSKDEFYVMADESLKDSPLGWAKRAYQVYKYYGVDKVIAETNNGGDLVESNIRNVYRNINVQQVRATRGKFIRAEPISGLYEQGRVHHVGIFPELEDQMCEWVPGAKSPDRVDALVWALHYLSQGITQRGNVASMDYSTPVPGVFVDNKSTGFSIPSSRFPSSL